MKSVNGNGPISAPTSFFSRLFGRRSSRGSAHKQQRRKTWLAARESRDLESKGKLSSLQLVLLHELERFNHLLATVAGTLRSVSRWLARSRFSKQA